MSAADGTDPRIVELRERLTENDVKIVEAFNVRLELVAQLKRVKEERGIGLIDPAREEWLREHLASQNRGPLSSEGLAELYAGLLDLTKREVDLPRGSD